jgi:DNA-binding XRE family transcriptional regulator
LEKVRRDEDLSVTDLATLSGIAPVTIYRIEDPQWEFKFNYNTAKALADALYVEVSDLFDHEELSHLGRPPHTGKACIQVATNPNKVVCPNCYLQVPKSLHCNQCEAPLSLSA